jgi:hypothetical protein
VRPSLLSRPTRSSRTAAPSRSSTSSRTRANRALDHQREGERRPRSWREQVVCVSGCVRLRSCPRRTRAEVAGTRASAGYLGHGAVLDVARLRARVGHEPGDVCCLPRWPSRCAGILPSDMTTVCGTTGQSERASGDVPDSSRFGHGPSVTLQPSREGAGAAYAVGSEQVPVLMDGWWALPAVPQGARVRSPVGASPNGHGFVVDVGHPHDRRRPPTARPGSASASTGPGPGDPEVEGERMLERGLDPWRATV